LKSGKLRWKIERSIEVAALLRRMKIADQI